MDNVGRLRCSMRTFLFGVGCISLIFRLRISLFQSPSIAGCVPYLVDKQLLVPEDEACAADAEKIVEFFAAGGALCTQYAYIDVFTRVDFRGRLLFALDAIVYQKVFMDVFVCLLSPFDASDGRRRHRTGAPIRRICNKKGGRGRLPPRIKRCIRMFVNACQSEERGHSPTSMSRISPLSMTRRMAVRTLCTP